MQHGFYPSSVHYGRERRWEMYGTKMHKILRTDANLSKALINAILLQPDLKPSDDIDVDVDRLRATYRRIPVLSSMMVVTQYSNYFSRLRTGLTKLTIARYFSPVHIDLGQLKTSKTRYMIC